MRKEHHILRTKNKWGSFGKPGSPDYGTLRYIRIKDIHDDHLEKIIPFIKQRLEIYTISSLVTMLDELEYRKLNKIKVPFTFG